MKWGWIDLLAGIPGFELRRWARCVSVLRIIRLFRGVRSVQRLTGLLFESKSRGGVAAVVRLTCRLVTSALVSILIFARAPTSNIRPAEDAVWWSVTTITTVDYGDKFPVTTEGRLIAMMRMFSGVGIWGTLSGIVASLVLGKVKAEEDEILVKIRALRAEVASLRRATTLSASICNHSSRPSLALGPVKPLTSPTTTPRGASPSTTTAAFSN